MSSSDSLPHIGFIGLGAMGFAMSTHLVRTGFPVTGYDIYEPTMDRWQSTCKEIPSSQGSIAKSPAEAVKSAEVVCLMVANHHHVHSALFEEKVGAVHALPKNCIVIINATIPPTQPSEVWSRLTKEFNRSDIRLIDAPVSGGTARSINGTLTIMASADDPKLLDDPKAKTVLQNLASKGQTLFTIPGKLGSGESAKALNQVMCGIHIVSASEIMGLAAVNGLDTQKFYDTLTSKDSSQTHRGWTWMFENRGPRMLSNDPPMSSATAIIDKDVGIICDEESRLKIELPLLNRAYEVLQTVMKTHAKADDSVIAQYYLGFNSSRQSLVVDQAGKSIASTDQSTLIKDLATAHAIIHLNSAYETFRFAQALDLMGPDQKKRWFAIISGAAGGSTTFTEVIPQVFEHAESNGVEQSFRKYALDTFGMDAVEKSTKIISNAKDQKYNPVLLEGAVKWLKDLISS